MPDRARHAKRLQRRSVAWFQRAGTRSLPAWETSTIDYTLSDRRRSLPGSIAVMETLDQATTINRHLCELENLTMRLAACWDGGLDPIGAFSQLSYLHEKAERAEQAASGISEAIERSRNGINLRRGSDLNHRPSIPFLCALEVVACFVIQSRCSGLGRWCALGATEAGVSFATACYRRPSLLRSGARCPAVSPSWPGLRGGVVGYLKADDTVCRSMRGARFVAPEQCLRSHSC